MGVSRLAGTWHTGELLGFDLETTGVERHADVPVSFALVEVAGGRVTRRIARLVDPGRDIPLGAVAVHGITTERAREEGMPLHDALVAVREAFVAASRRGVPVVGMNLSYDLTMVDHQLRLAGDVGLPEAGWQGPALDVLVLDRHLDPYRSGKRRLEHLCAHYGVSLEAAHEAGADAEAAVRVLDAMCLRFADLRETAPSELTRLQADWHRSWVEQHSDWRQRQGRGRLAPGEGAWPLARVDDGALRQGAGRPLRWERA